MIQTDTPDDPSTDPFDVVLENEDAVETLTDREDRIGAAARVILALARDEDPSFEDLDAAGIPVGPAEDFTKEGSK